MKQHDDKRSTTWAPPTRRAFIAMVGAAAAALALKQKTRGPDGDPSRSARAHKTLWIGHC